MQLHRIVLVGHVVYMAIAFGWRSWLQWRRTGSTGFHGLSGAIGSPSWWGGVLLIVAILLAGATPVAIAADAWSPWPWPTEVRIIGAGLVVLGSAITIVAQMHMGNSWRIGVSDQDSTALVSSGLFALVRNPIFTAMLMYLLGSAMVLPCASSLLAFVAAWLGLELQVRLVEEPYLLRSQGESYARYSAQVGRFMPWFGRLNRRA